MSALCALILVAVACGGDEPSEPEASEPVPPQSPTPDPTCPMTGAIPEHPSDLTKPAVAVKIENSPESRPQSGLEDADIVFEEIVEGGITRFMAIYHCGVTDQAGPVRSARFDDPKLALPFTQVLAFSGANAIVERELTDQGIIPLDEDSAAGALFRDPPGSLDVHSLYANVTDLKKAARRQKVEAPATDMFTFGELQDGAKKARTVTVHFRATNTIEYKWEGGSWKRYEAGVAFMSASGSQISIPNLVIMQVDVNNSQTIVDVAGNPSPDIDLLSKGKALLFRDGQVVKGGWSMADAGEPPVFETKDGTPFVFAEGPIWIELVPSKKGTVKGSFAFSKK
jgi:hypothetical protein